MEIELKTIIEKIKQEGVGEAEKQAQAVLDEARAKAKTMLEEAAKKADETRKQAEKAAGQFKANGEEAVRQASRDAILGLRESITLLFDRIIKRNIASQLSPDIIRDMLVKMVDDLKKESSMNIEILLNEKDKKAVEDLLTAALGAEMRKGITLKVSPNIESGFRIGEKGQNAYYDFTDEAIAEAFKAYLNPKLAQILDGGK